MRRRPSTSPGTPRAAEGRRMGPAAPSPGPGWLLRQRRLLGLLISGGLVMLVVASVIGFSGAYFTSTSQSPGQRVRGRRDDARRWRSPGQIIDGDGMVPGDTRTGEQTVTNTGHRGLLVLEAQDLTEHEADPGPGAHGACATTGRRRSRCMTGRSSTCAPSSSGRWSRTRSRHYTFTAELAGASGLARPVRGQHELRLRLAAGLAAVTATAITATVAAQDHLDPHPADDDRCAAARR